MAGPFESAAGAGANSAAAAGLMRGFAEGLRDKSARDLKAELDQRERLAKEFQRIADDPTYDRQERDAAERHYIALNMLDLTKKRPKEYQPDKAYGGTPQALFEIKWRKVQKEGPKEPAEPTQPQEPADPSAIPAPPPVDLTGLGTADLGANESVPPGLPPMPDMGLAPVPGGQQTGPNQISAAPAVPGAGAPAVPPSLEPMPFNPADFESTRMSDQQVAQREADLAQIKNRVNLAPDATGAVDARALPALGRQQTTAVQMRKLGLAPDGTPIPEDQLAPAERAKIGHLKAQGELMDAQEELAKARAAGVPAMIQIAQQRLAVAQQNANTAQSRVGIDAALLSSVVGGGGTGGMQGLLGDDGNINNPVDAWSELVYTHQADLKDVPGGKFGSFKNAVALNMVRNNMIVAPPEAEKAMTAMSGARAAVENVYAAIDQYAQSGGTEAIWKALKIPGVVAANSRIVGKAMGELRITDQDKDDFEGLLSPGTVLTITNPQRAKEWVSSVNQILDRVEQRSLGGLYKVIYARRGGKLDTLEPGSQKNVVAELGGDETPKPVAARPATTPAALPPIGQRVAGVTHATIGGVDRVWNGTGWAKPK